MRKIYLLGSFVAGFSVMTVELLASRIVAPIIGSSVFTWTSVIGTTLLGLSIGSYFGGKIADKVKKDSLLSSVFLISSVLVFFIPFFVKGVTPILDFTSSILLINLLVSLYLFLIPATIMGAIQPIILKKYAENMDKIGQEYGLLSSLWSAGSILGVFLTGFFFVSTIGSVETIQIISAILLILSLLFSLKNKSFIKLFILPVFILLTLFFLMSHNDSQKSNLLYEKETNYYKIRVADRNLPPYGDTRFLFLDIDSHNVISKNKEIDSYTKISPIFSEINKNPENILIIGAGAYELPRYFKEKYENSKVSVIEIDPEIETVGKRFFNLGKTEIKTIISDARIFLQKDSQKYDIIFGDAYNSFISVPWYLLTDEFNNQTKNKLTEKGVYALNFIGKLSGQGSEMAKSIYNTFKKTFPNNIIFGFGSNLEDTQNIVLLGLKESFDLDKVKKNISARYSSFGEKIVDTKVLQNKDSLLLKDNFSPIEKLMEPITREYFYSYINFINKLNI